MDTMVQFYMEETEDLLQKAEECLIRLETEYSSVDVNELFRIAHTIKGSSQMVGYEDIGNVMHKIEDMLDCARNGTILFDQGMVSLCFKGLDIVKKMLRYKKGQRSGEVMEDFTNDVSRINEMFEAFISANKKEEENTAAEQPAMGIVASLLNKKPESKNKYYISFFIEKDAPMVSPVFIMILKCVEDIGSLVYSSVTDSYFSESPEDNEIRTFDIILCTDVEEAELYTYFDLSYVEKINIVDLTRSKLEDNDYYFNNSDNTFYIAVLGVFIKLYNIFFSRPKELKVNKEELHIIESLRSKAVNAFEKINNKNKLSAFINDFNEFFSIVTKMYEGQSEAGEELCSNIRTHLLKLMERANNYAKGKHVFRVLKPEKNDFINRLKNFTGMVNNSSTLVIFIDLSNLDILHENEVKALIEVKKQMEEKNIKIGIIAGGCYSRRIINIFDSIKPVEEFNLFSSELDAILGMLYSQDSFQRIIRKVKSEQYE
ncbi:MAG TPA: hypothetical protein GXX36_15775 [Clostridiaceae bacterium]|nr:hypothetical protein [Clostridiaceae bacterium]